MRTPIRNEFYNYGFAAGLALATTSMLALVIVVNINPAPTVQGTVTAFGVLAGAGIALANTVGVVVTVVNKVRQTRT